MDMVCQANHQLLAFCLFLPCIPILPWNQQVFPSGSVPWPSTIKREQKMLPYPGQNLGLWLRAQIIRPSHDAGRNLTTYTISSISAARYQSLIMHPALNMNTQDCPPPLRRLICHTVNFGLFREGEIQIPNPAAVQ